MTNRTALVIGATGLVGGLLLEKLLREERYSEVHVIARRELPLQHPKLKVHLGDFDRLVELAPFFKVQDVFCCLGTTLKKAGSKAAFVRVDYSYVFKSAQLAAQQGAEKFLLVSSTGADARSSFFYPRVKGETEQAVATLPFREVHIFRPSILAGARQEHRLGEKIGLSLLRPVGPLLVGPLKRMRPVAADKVAEALLQAALEKTGIESGKVQIHETEEIQRVVVPAQLQARA